MEVMWLRTGASDWSCKHSDEPEISMHSREILDDQNGYKLIISFQDDSLHGFDTF
jgi:hypothetical protein